MKGLEAGRDAEDYKIGYSCVDLLAMRTISRQASCDWLLYTTSAPRANIVRRDRSTEKQGV